MVCLRAPVSGSHSLTSWYDPEASVLPSIENASDSTSEMWAALAGLPSDVLRFGSTRVFRNSPVGLYRGSWLPRPEAPTLPSALTATARTGLTIVGGRLSTTFGRTRAMPTGGLAPWSIQSLTRASSGGVIGTSSLGGMIGFCCREQSL